MTHVVIMRDFNYPSISWDNANINLSADSELFYEVINDNLLVQHMPFNTRFKEGNVPSKLDLLFTNEEEMIDNNRINSLRQICTIIRAISLPNKEHMEN